MTFCRDVFSLPDFLGLFGEKANEVQLVCGLRDLDDEFRDTVTPLGAADALSCVDGEAARLFAKRPQRAERNRRAGDPE